MLEELKKRWQEFKQGEPGKRFRDRYFRRRRTPRSQFWKMTLLAGGTLIMAVGVVMLVAPGPGILVLVLGASLVAQESLTLARLLDRTELVARKVAAWGLLRWRSLKRRLASSDSPS